MIWFIILIIGILIFCLYLFLLFPGKKKDMEWLCNRPIAHRGYHNQTKMCPENSKEAFLRAIEKNYHIEIDIRLTKDNEVVVFHDENVVRMCGKNSKVRDLTLAELKKLKLLGGTEEILTLKEFLDLVDKKVGCLIEFKETEDAILEPIAWEILKDYEGKWAMQSFQPSKLKWFKKNAPHILRGQLCLNYMDNKEKPWLIKFMFTNLLSNFIGRPQFISYHYSGVNKLNVKLLRKMHVPLFVWNIENEKIYQAVKGKCENIIFENLEW